MNFEVTVIKNNCFSIVINKNNVINVHVYVSIYTQCKVYNFCYTELKSFLIILKYPLSFIRFSVSMSVIFWLIFHDIFSFVFFSSKNRVCNAGLGAGIKASLKKRRLKISNFSKSVLFKVIGLVLKKNVHRSLLGKESNDWLVHAKGWRQKFEYFIIIFMQKKCKREKCCLTLGTTT